MIPGNLFLKGSLVKEAGLGVKATSEFLFMFNFDFNHEEYFQELEALGGY